MTSNRTFPLSGGVPNPPQVTRRPNHGTTAAFSVSNPLIQPQDGAMPTAPAKVSSIDGHTLLGREPEDARLTGATRSLFRRVMGLNVSAVLDKARIPAKARTPQKAMPASAETASTVKQQQVA